MYIYICKYQTCRSSIQVSLICPCVLFTPRLVPESVRWLLTKDRGDEAQKVITKVAKVNGKVIEPNLITQLDVTTNQKRSSVIDLFRHCKLAKLALNVWFQG